MHESLAGQNKPLGSGPAAGGVGDSRGIAEVMAHRLGTAEGQQRDGGSLRASGGDGAGRYLGKVAATGGELKLITVHDRKELLPHILRLSHRASLDEILEAPRIGELGGRPCLWDGWGGRVTRVR